LHFSIIVFLPTIINKVDLSLLTLLSLSVYCQKIRLDKDKGNHHAISRWLHVSKHRPRDSIQGCIEWAMRTFAESLWTDLDFERARQTNSSGWCKLV